MDRLQCLILGLLLFSAVQPRARAELLQTFDVLEGVPVGTVIGVIGSDGSSELPQPPYLIVPLAGSPDPDTDLIINQKTGEIRTKSELDREKTRSYSLSAIPLNGESISVTVRVVDVNDNSPEFVPDFVRLDIPENIPSGTRRKLAPAVDQVRYFDAMVLLFVDIPITDRQNVDIQMADMVID
jgi:hypothetical protein